MSKFKEYIEESYNELIHKVSWPSYSELQTSAIIVMVSSLIIAGLIFLMDSAFSNLLELFYDLF